MLNSDKEEIKERFNKCLERIDKEVSKIKTLPSIWEVNSKYFDFVKESDLILLYAGNICFQEGVQLSILFDSEYYTDCSSCLIKQDDSTMDILVDSSETMYLQFQEFMSTMYKILNIPKALLIFGCSMYIQKLNLKVVHFE